MSDINIEIHNGIRVLRDDKLAGGTKSVLMPFIITDEYDEYLYASPVYGGFQIALAAYCSKVGKKAHIFCAKRNELHSNTKKVIELGGVVHQVPHGYLNVVESYAKRFIEQQGFLGKKIKKLDFGAHNDLCKNILTIRCLDVLNKIGKEPDEIWCAIGSGTLVEGIISGTFRSQIFGVAVGKEYNKQHDRLTIIKYPKPFDYETKFETPFQSMPNYDRKAWEICNKISNKDKNILFWNVY